MLNTATASAAQKAGWSGSYQGVAPVADAFAGNASLTPAATAPTPTPGSAATTAPWNFTVSPEDISWTTNAEVDRVKIFGTNSPPVTSGTQGMRDLSLSNCLLEGFSRGVQVEDQVTQLEALMNYTLNTDKGFVNIPVYNLKANSKLYGDASGADGGFFVIKDIKVKESMRDLSGIATRVNVDVSLVQVPAYQVDSGRDQASQPVAGSKAAFPEQQAEQGDKPKSGPGAPSPKGGSKAAETYLGVKVPAGSTNIKVNQNTKLVSWKDANGVSYSKKGV
jgi:hypothetical protein